MMLARYQDLVLPSLRRLVEHQRRHDAGERYECRFLHSVVDQLRGQGIDLPAWGGPWTVGARWLQGPGRGGLPVIPLVQRGDTVVMTDTWDEARRLAGLLNWCHAPSLAHSLVPKMSHAPAVSRFDPARVVPSISPLLAGVAAATPSPKRLRGGRGPRREDALRVGLAAQTRGADTGRPV